MDVDAPTTPGTDPDVGDVDEGHGAPAGKTTPDHSTGLVTDHNDHEAEHLSDNRYIVIAAILAAITAAEVAASYIDLGPVFIPLLLILMAIKFLTVILYFMHLKFDNKIFQRLFYMGLVLAVVVYVAALATFRFFDS